MPEVIGGRAAEVEPSLRDKMLRDSQVLVLPDGSRVGFAEYGDAGGAPVLALHGAPASRVMFAAADAAAKTHRLRILAPDRPGYGLTPFKSEPTLAHRTQWLHAVVDALHLDRFGVLGIFGGSPYAVALAAAMPHRVAALALVSPMGPVADYTASADAKLDPLSYLHDRFFLHLPYRTWLSHPLGEISAWMFRHGPEMFTGLMPKLSSATDSHILAKPEVAQLMRSMTLEAFRQGGSGSTADMEIFGRPWGVQFADIAAPTIVWQGADDTVVPPQAARWLARQIPDCRLHMLEETGHFWIFEHVDEVVGAVAALMSQPRNAEVRVS